MRGSGSVPDGKGGGKVVNMFPLQGSEGSLESTACSVKNTSPAASLSARFCGSVSCPPPGLAAKLWGGN